MRQSRFSGAFLGVPLILGLAACSAGAGDGSSDGASTGPELPSGSTQAPAATTDAPSPATTTTSGDGTTDTAEHPCSRCAEDEFCRWNGADDACSGIPEVTCEPLPDGCTLSELCTLACVHEICSSYQCWFGDPCDYGGIVLCEQNHHCDPWDPNPCSVDGTMCTLVSNEFSDFFACVPAPEPGAPVGAPCTITSDGHWSWGDCVAGAVCSRVDGGTMQGVCKALCTGTPEEPVCADPATACTEWSSDSVEIHLCEARCDPLVGAAACPPGEVCVELDPICVPDASGEGGAYTEPCEYVNSCDPGLVCIFPEFVPNCELGDVGCCTPYCDVSQPECPPDSMCLSIFGTEKPTPGLEDLGFCGVPP